MSLCVYIKIATFSLNLFSGWSLETTLAWKETTRWKRKVFPKHFDHQVIAGQPERSFNHHLSVGTGAPICDRCDGAAPL